MESDVLPFYLPYLLVLVHLSDYSSIVDTEEIVITRTSSQSLYFPTFRITLSTSQREGSCYRVTRPGRKYRQGETWIKSDFYIFLKPATFKKVRGIALMPDHLVDCPVLGIGFGAVIEEVSSTSLPLFHLDI